MKKSLGFTLVELLIAISIIGILVTIGISSYATINKQSRDVKRKNDIEQLRSALEMYRAENKNYPTAGCVSTTCTAADVSSLSTEIADFLTTIPTDPKIEFPYLYKATNEVGGVYYGYCLSVKLEKDSPTNSCTPEAGYSWGVSHP